MTIKSEYWYLVLVLVHVLCNSSSTRACTSVTYMVHHVQAKYNRVLRLYRGVSSFCRENYIDNNNKRVLRYMFSVISQSRVYQYHYAHLLRIWYLLVLAQVAQLRRCDHKI